MEYFLTLRCRDAACRINGFSFPLHKRDTSRPYIFRVIFYIVVFPFFVFHVTNQKLLRISGIEMNQ